MMKFDEVLVQIGEFGAYQRRIYFLLCLPAINVGIFALISVFVLYVPNHRSIVKQVLTTYANHSRHLIPDGFHRHDGVLSREERPDYSYNAERQAEEELSRCAIPGYDNDTYAVQSDYHEMLINKTIPPATDEKFAYDECKMYSMANVAYNDDNKPINASEMKCSKWVYQTTDFTATFTTENDLICDNKFLPSLAKMLYSCGVFVGAISFGHISDLVGRKKTLMVAFLFNFGAGTGLAWVETYPVFATVMFLLGASNPGIFMTGFVIGMELVGPSKRMWAGIVVEYFFAMGVLILSGVAYGLHDWRTLVMAVAFPNVLYLLYFLIVPESPRWLLSQGRFKEAEQVVKKAAKVNKASLPDKLFDKDSIDKNAPKGKLWHLFSTKVMAIRTLVIFFNWMVVCMVYYGLSLNTGNLEGNFYLNFALSGLVEFPAYTLCLLLLDRLGRKWLHCLTMVLGGVACVCTVFTTIYGGESLHALTVTLAMIGKLGAAAAYAVIFVFSAELYPTVVRHVGLGASSCCAQIGGILAPYIADMNKVVSGDLGRVLPLVIFGAASVTAGVMALILPETLHKELPESIKDAENLGRKHHKEREKEVYFNVGYRKDDYGAFRSPHKRYSE